MEYEDKIFGEEPSCLVWVVPCLAVIFTLFAGLEGIAAFMVRADTPEQLQGLKEAQVQAVWWLVAAVALWGVVITRVVLGHGKQQKETLKNTAQLFMPTRQKASTADEDILVRASTPNAATSSELLRPIQNSTPSDPQELLRASGTTD